MPIHFRRRWTTEIDINLSHRARVHRTRIRNMTRSVDRDDERRLLILFCPQCRHLEARITSREHRYNCLFCGNEAIKGLRRPSINDAYIPSSTGFRRNPMVEDVSEVLRAYVRVPQYQYWDCTNADGHWGWLDDV